MHYIMCSSETGAGSPEICSGKTFIFILSKSIFLGLLCRTGDGYLFLYVKFAVLRAMTNRG